MLLINTIQIKEALEMVEYETIIFITSSFAKTLTIIVMITSSISAYFGYF